jgi:hypothetical protein
VIADLEKQNDNERGVSTQKKPASEPHTIRARRRSIVKPATSLRRRTKRASSRRRGQRAARVGGDRQSRF